MPLISICEFHVNDIISRIIRTDNISQSLIFINCCLYINVSSTKSAEGAISNRAVRKGCHYDDFFSERRATPNRYNRCRSFRPHTLKILYNGSYEPPCQVSGFQPSQNMVTLFYSSNRRYIEYNIISFCGCKDTKSFEIKQSFQREKHQSHVQFVIYNVWWKFLKSLVKAK